MVQVALMTLPPDHGEVIFVIQKMVLEKRRTGRSTRTGRRTAGARFPGSKCFGRLQRKEEYNAL
jgi:hypothetical protein